MCHSERSEACARAKRRESRLSILATIIALSLAIAVAFPAFASAEAPSGDPNVGKQYFTGARHFQNGGSACIACHSVAGLGALGGGAVGPDLTQAYDKFGDGGLSAILATLPFATMQPIYAARPLTPEEQADLKAFFQQTAISQRATESLAPLALLAVLGAAILFLLSQLVWRQRLLAVRQPLVKRSRREAQP